MLNARGGMGSGIRDHERAFRRARCTNCELTFAVPRAAYLHWLKEHSMPKLRGLGERAVLDDLDASRDRPRPRREED